MIHTLPSPKQDKKSRRVGRGQGSGKGAHTTGRGHKGQRSRTGYTKPGPAFEGGQNPLSKRLPQLRGMYGSGNRTRKRGFITAKEQNIGLQLTELAEAFDAKETVNMSTLIEKGIVSPKAHKELYVKILFDGNIKTKLTVEGIPASKKAVEAIEKAGGSIA